MKRGFFQLPEEWEVFWDGMPEFRQEDQSSFDSITVHFEKGADRAAFLTMMEESPKKRKSIWYPRKPYLQQSERTTGPRVVEPNQYPIYVISKGRWESLLTAKALEKLSLPYHLVIEPQEREKYGKRIAAERLLVLPFSDLGEGSIPARNWVWDHAVETGASWHWILDDNLDGFYRLNKNLKTKVIAENPFTPVEDFVDRYENIALAGLNYEFLITRREKHPPFYLNTRIYSCILINHALSHRWRGRYNEDTDLSIRALKDGWCTVLFNAFLAKKMPTMKLTGGNTEDLYEGDGRLQMAESLREQHPDVVTITRKWGRAQHQVNYRPFKRNKLKEKE